MTDNNKMENYHMPRSLIIDEEEMYIHVTLFDKGSGSIDSNLHGTDTADESYNNVIDGIEALILAHALAGIEITSPGYISGLRTALETIDNHDV